MDEIRKQIKLLDFIKNYNKSLYLETMKLINGEIEEKQLVKDFFYNDLVESIYLNCFKELEENSILFSQGNYQAYENPNLLSIYIKSAVDTYNKIRDLNIYFSNNFKPYDKELAHYVSGQFINYFRQRYLFPYETEESFVEKMSKIIDKCGYHPFRKAPTVNYNVEEINGINMKLNDLIYLSKMSNNELKDNIGITLEDLLAIRSGNVKYTKDILYLIFLGLRISKYESEKFINKLTDSEKEELGEFNTKRDEMILNYINDISMYRNIERNENKNILTIINELLIDNNIEPINNSIEKEKKDEDVITIFLTGGFGFVGRRCIDYFNEISKETNIKYKICVLTDNAPQYIPENVICYQGDITKKLVYERIFSENKIDYVIHLAAISTVSRGANSLEETLMINEQAPNAMYSTILENKFPVKCIIFPSTVQVYQGTNNDVKYCYEEEPIMACRIRNDYAYSKYQAEQNAKRYARYGVPIIITRLSNVFGEGDINSRLIPETIRRLKRNENTCIYVDEKENTRSELLNFIYIDDLMEAFNKIFTMMNENPIMYDYENPDNIIFNIGNSESHRVYDVVKKIYELLEIEFNPDIKKVKLGSDKIIDINKAIEILNLSEATELEEGLQKILKRY